jgi:hypothetical protein
MTGDARPPAALGIPAWLLNAAIAALLVAMAAWLWIGAEDIADTGGVVGPAGFPRAIAILLGGSALLVLFQAAHSARLADRHALVRVHRPVSVGLAIVLVVLYPLLISKVGYYIATAVWLAPFLVVCGMRSVLGVFATTAGFLLFTKVLFQMVLGTPLP